MDKHCRVQSFFKRTFRWIGRNLILSVVIVALGIALWPSNIPGIYRSKNTIMKESLQMEYAMDSAAPMATKSMARGIGGGAVNVIMPPVYADDFAPEATDRKIIKNASLQIEVADTEIARKAVEQKINELKGTVTNLYSYEIRPRILSYNLTIRIPSESLIKTMEALIALGVKKSESINEQDITAQYVDTESRLKNLEVRRDRLRALMDRETENLADVLSVDRELSSVQQEIENYERILKSHDTNVAFSTISLTLQPEPQIGDFNTPEWTVKKSWKQSVNDLIGSLKEIFDGALQVIVFAPIWIPILLVLWAIQKFIRRRCCPIQIKK